MTHLICNFDLEDEVVRAFQTILNAISCKWFIHIIHKMYLYKAMISFTCIVDRKKLNAIQKERDSLLSLLRTFETER